MREGDWICLQCNNHNYADKLKCNRHLGQLVGTGTIRYGLLSIRMAAYGRFRHIQACCCVPWGNNWHLRGR
eukprot:Skav212765  [mRNA]  locus=scaffold2545:478311:478523:- [translate_table: standard]